MIIYDSKKIIPAPLVTIQKNYIRTADGTKIGAGYTITLTGKLFPCKGSPLSGGTFHTTSGYPADETEVADKHEALITKLQALKKLFATEGGGCTLEIQPATGSTPLKCYARPTTPVVAAEGLWVDYIDYTVTLEADKFTGSLGDDDSFAQNLSDASEDWTLEFNDESSEHTFRLTHNVSAVGKLTYTADGDYPGYIQAKGWVVPRLGLDNTFLYATSGFNLSQGYGAYNHVRSESTDELGGRYAVTETWIISSGNVIEDFNIESRKSLDSPLTTVTINGNIVGLETDTNMQVSQSRWDAANVKYSGLMSSSPYHTIYNRAKIYSGVNLNPTALGSTVGKNIKAGTVTYNYEYDDRPTNFISGAYSENISVSNKYQTDIFAAIPIIGRAAGPLFQNINTKSEHGQSINIEVVVNPFTGSFNAANLLAASPKNQVDVLVSRFRTALEASYTDVYTGNDTDNWNPKTGRYTRSVDLIYGN